MAKPLSPFLYVPNLIGYARIVALIVSCAYWSTNPVYSTLSYAVSYLLDAFDGFAARALGQSTYFGAVLDMMTDRAASAVLLAVLSGLYGPVLRFFFLFFIILDIGSHWMHMYATVFLHPGASHKAQQKSNFFMRLYYTNQKVLFAFCAGEQGFLLSLYLATFFPLQGWLIGAWISFPFFVVKQFVNFLQLVAAARELVEHQRKEKS